MCVHFIQVHKKLPIDSKSARLISRDFMHHKFVYILIKYRQTISQEKIR